MIRLGIDKKLCVSCGNCEAWLPGLMSAIPHGGVMISEHNESVDAEAIQRAIDGCFLGALTLEVVA